MELRTFRRFVGPGTPALGSDTPPTALITTADSLFRRLQSTQSEQTIAGMVAAYHYTGAGVAPSIAVDVYVYDWSTKRFFLLGRTTLAPDRIAFIDLPANVVGDMATGLGAQPGSLEAVFVPIAAGGEPVGSYDFGATFCTAAGANMASADLLAVLTAINGKLPTLGQKAMAGSIPVTIASDQTVVATAVNQTDLNNAVGTTADAKVDTDAVGTLSSKLRGIVSRLLSLDTQAASVITTEGGAMAALGQGLKLVGKYVLDPTLSPLVDGTAGFAFLDALHNWMVSLGTLISGEHQLHNTLCDVSYRERQRKLGKTFMWPYRAEVDIATPAQLTIAIPNSAIRPDVQFFFTCSAGGVLVLRKNPTITVAGTLITPSNMSQDSGNVALCSVRHTPTITVAGDEVASWSLGAGTSCPITLPEPIECSVNEDYALEFTPTANDTLISVQIVISEDDNLTWDES